MKMMVMGEYSSACSKEWWVRCLLTEAFKNIQSWPGGQKLVGLLPQLELLAVFSQDTTTCQNNATTYPYRKYEYTQFHSGMGMQIQ